MCHLQTAGDLMYAAHQFPILSLNIDFHSAKATQPKRNSVWNEWLTLWDNLINTYSTKASTVIAYATEIFSQLSIQLLTTPEKLYRTELGLDCVVQRQITFFSWERARERDQRLVWYLIRPHSLSCSKLIIYTQRNILPLQSLTADRLRSVDSPPTLPLSAALQMSLPATEERI